MQANSSGFCGFIVLFITFCGILSACLINKLKTTLKTYAHDAARSPFTNRCDVTVYFFTVIYIEEIRFIQQLKSDIKTCKPSAKQNH